MSKPKNPKLPKMAKRNMSPAEKTAAARKKAMAEGKAKRKLYKKK